MKLISRTILCGIGFYFKDFIYHVSGNLNLRYMDFINLNSEELLSDFDDIGINLSENLNFFQNSQTDNIRELSNQVALDSPWGKESLFYTSKYITDNIDFVKLVAFIKTAKDVEFDYKKFIGSSTRTINKSISYGEEAKFDRMANIPTSYSTTQQYKTEIPITVKSYSQERVLNLQGKLNAIKDTINLYNNGPKDRTGGLEFEFDYKKRIVNYKVHFYYVGKNRVFEKENKDNIAITISSSSFEDFTEFLSLCGRGLDLDRIAGNSDFEIEIKDSFLSALKEVTGRDDKGTYGEKLDPIKFRHLDWLYQNIPAYVAKELDFGQNIENIFKLSFWDDLNKFGDDTTAGITSLLTKLDHKNVYNYFQKNPDKLISLYNNFSDDSLVEKLCQYLTAITLYYKGGEINNPRTFTSSGAAHIETNILYGDNHGKVELTNELQMPLMPFNNLSLLNWVTKDAEINNPKNTSNQFHPLEIIYISRYDAATNENEIIPTIALYGKYLGDKSEWSDVIDASLAVVDIISIAISAGVLSAGVRGVARIFAIIDITFSTINLTLLSPGVKSILNKTEAGRWFVLHWGIISFCVSAGTISYYLAKGILKYGPEMRKGLNSQDELAKQVDELVEEARRIAGMAENIRIAKNIEKVREFLEGYSKLQKIKPEEALDHIHEALKYFNHKVVGDEIIQISDTNCVNVVKAVDNFLETGIIRSVNHSEVQNIIELERIYNRSFLQYNIPSLKKVMKEGERGIIFGDKGPYIPGHVFNVVKKNNELLFLEGQLLSGKVNLQSGYIKFKYLKTK